MKPPTRFELQGRTIRVVEVDEIANGDAYGSWDPDDDRMRIQADLPRDLRYATFLHECCHAWMDALNRHDLSKDEAFVDGLAGLVHQMLKSQRFD